MDSQRGLGRPAALRQECGKRGVWEEAGAGRVRDSARLTSLRSPWTAGALGHTHGHLLEGLSAVSLGWRRRVKTQRLSWSRGHSPLSRGQAEPGPRRPGWRVQSTRAETCGAHPAQASARSPPHPEAACCHQGGYTSPASSRLYLDHQCPSSLHLVSSCLGDVSPSPLYLTLHVNPALCKCPVACHSSEEGFIPPAPHCGPGSWLTGTHYINSQGQEQTLRKL